MRQPEHSAAARVAAAGILLDRGWGKAQVTVAGEDGSEIKIVIRRLVDEDNAKLIEGSVLRTIDQDVKKHARGVGRSGRRRLIHN
jgi:hypothetical protein